MSSDLYTFDISFHTHSSSDTLSHERNRDPLFSSDPFPFLTSSPIQGNLNNSLDPFVSLYSHQNQINISNDQNINSVIRDFSALDGSEVKSEACQVGVDYSISTYKYNINQQFVPQSDGASKLMQRSFSCDSMDGKPDFNLPFEAIMDSTNFQWKSWSSPEESVFTREIRKVCSAGDLQKMKENYHVSRRESPSLEEANFKVGRYSAQVRKEKISKYRAKRSQRKFNKTIKYACRKTLADNRIRIRGRFARNDETDIPKAPSSSTDEHEHEFWVELIEGLNQELLA